MKEVIVVLVGFLVLIFVGSQVGCLITDIFDESKEEDDNLDDEF